jgi:hypothetical protein
MQALKTINKGDFLKRKIDSKKVYIRGDYCQSQKKYSCINIDDHCNEIFIKGDAIVASIYDFDME